MALEISREVCVECSEYLLTVEDTTGVYDATSNPTGWGSPNYAIADVQAAYITITFADGTQQTVDCFPTLPNTSGTLFTITNEDLGYGESEQIDDQVITLAYTVLGVSSGTPFQVTCSNLELLKCNAQCCVNERMAEVEVGCGCSSNEETQELFFMLTAAEYAAECGKKERAQALIDFVNDKCGNGCASCD